MEPATCTAGAFPNQCSPKQSPVTGPDGRPYRVDTYIWVEAQNVSSRPLKVVTIVVRDGDEPSRTLVREQSTFDQSTGS